MGIDVAEKSLLISGISDRVEWLALVQGQRDLHRHKSRGECSFWAWSRLLGPNTRISMNTDTQPWSRLECYLQWRGTWKGGQEENNRGKRNLGPHTHKLNVSPS